MKVKVCGMTKPEQLAVLDDLGVAFAGFIFYPLSPRYVFQYMSAREIKDIRFINMLKTGVFANASIDDVLQSVEDCGLDIVQLHGDETPEYCAEVSAVAPTIKAIRLIDSDTVKELIEPYANAADMFLFDRDGAGYGGTGKKFNWELLKNTDINKPFFLSGGLSPEDIDLVKSFALQPVAKNLFGIDLNSGFELSPGVKNLDTVARFVQQLSQ